MCEWHFYASGPDKTNEKKKWTTGTEAEKELIREKIRLALAWEKKTGIETWVGAWMAGNYNKGDDYSIDEQVNFANFVTCELTKNNIPFAFNSDVKFYDRLTNNWIKKTGQEDLALYGGDDYQTILTSSKNKRAKIEKLIQKNNLSLSRVGTITKDRKLCINDNGIEIKLKKQLPFGRPSGTKKQYSVREWYTF